MSYTVSDGEWRSLRDLNREGKLSERNERIVDLVVDRGLTCAEVAWGMRLSGSMISKIVKDSGRDNRPTREQIRAATKARRLRALALREGGMTFRAIGEDLGVSIERARQVVSIARRVMGGST
jgi:transposase